MVKKSNSPSKDKKTAQKEEKNKNCDFMDKMTWFNNYMIADVPPQILYFPMNWTVNAAKGGVMITMISLMIYFDNFTLRNWVYTSLHGAYGWLWVLKDLSFPDPGFSNPASIGTHILAFFGILLPYMAGGYYMISDKE